MFSIVEPARVVWRRRLDGVLVSTATVAPGFESAALSPQSKSVALVYPSHVAVHSFSHAFPRKAFWPGKRAPEVVAVSELGALIVYVHHEPLGDVLTMVDFAACAESTRRLLKIRAKRLLVTHYGFVAVQCAEGVVVLSRDGELTHLLEKASLHDAVLCETQMVMFVLNAPVRFFDKVERAVLATLRTRAWAGFWTADVYADVLACFV